MDANPEGRAPVSKLGEEVVVDPGRNERVVLRRVETLSRGWSHLTRVRFDYRRSDGSWSEQSRESYDRGDGATVLLYDVDRRRVVLIRQLRLPAYLNGHPDGMLYETAAGLLEGDDAEAAVRREAEEETGYAVGEPEPVFELYMSPGSVTERLHFFAAPYSESTRAAPGGGLAEDGEDIEVVELGIDEALELVRSGEIVDAKTVLLLQWAVLSGPFAPAWRADRREGGVSAPSAGRGEANEQDKERR